MTGIPLYTTPEKLEELLEEVDYLLVDVLKGQSPNPLDEITSICLAQQDVIKLLCSVVFKKS